MWPLRIRRSVGYRYFQIRGFRSQLNRLFKDKCESDVLKTPKPRDAFKSHTTPGRYKYYKFLTFFVGLPLVLTSATASLIYKEEKEREPFVPYTHMRIRHKKFPWGNGDRSFFHHPKYNALPDGYEDELEEK